MDLCVSGTRCTAARTDELSSMLLGLDGERMSTLAKQWGNIPRTLLGCLQLGKRTRGFKDSTEKTPEVLSRNVQTGQVE